MTFITAKSYFPYFKFRLSSNQNCTYVTAGSGYFVIWKVRFRLSLCKTMPRGIQKDMPQYAKRCSGAELLHIFSAAVAYHFYPSRHRFLGAGRHLFRLSGACFWTLRSIFLLAGARTLILFSHRNHGNHRKGDLWSQKVRSHRFHRFHRYWRPDDR